MCRLVTRLRLLVLLPGQRRLRMDRLRLRRSLRLVRHRLPRLRLGAPRMLLAL